MPHIDTRENKRRRSRGERPAVPQFGRGVHQVDTERRDRGRGRTSSPCTAVGKGGEDARDVGDGKEDNGVSSRTKQQRGGVDRRWEAATNIPDARGRRCLFQM